MFAPTSATGVAIACPRDGSPLMSVSREGTRIDRCSSCHGLWFDAHALGKVAHDRELERVATRIPRFAPVSAFACPRCKGACFQTFVGDVQVDACCACHGVWCDAGELEDAEGALHAERALAGAGSGFRAFLGRL